MISLLINILLRLLSSFSIHNKIIYLFNQITQPNMKFLDVVSTLLLSYFAVLVSPWCLKASITQGDKVKSVDYSPDGSMMGLAMKNKTIRIYDSLSLALKLSFTVPNEPNVIKFNGPGTHIVVGSATNDVRVVTIATGAGINLPSGHGVVYSLDFNSDSSLLVTCGKDNELKTWNALTWSTTPITSVTSTTDFMACQFTSTNQLFVGQLNGNVKLYSNPYNAGALVAGSTILYGGSPFSTLSNRYGTTDYIAAQNTNKRLFANPDNTNPIYTTTGGKLIFTTSYAKSLDYFMIGGAQKLVLFFNATNKNNTLLQSIATTGEILSSDFSNDGKYLIVGCDDNNAYIYQQYCMNCQSNYFFNSTSKVCELCSVMEGCGACYSGTVCAICSQGYYMATNKTCIPCMTPLPGCSVCANSTNCTTPLPGYYITTTFTAEPCVSAIPGCLICNSSAICLQCHNQYYLNTNTCRACSLSAFCLKCYNSTYCTQCEAGYFPNVVTTTSTCTRCGTNCLDCQSLTACFECVLGFYTTGASCLACTANCLACNNTNFCFDCASNYFITATGTCSPCTVPCLSCSTSATTCLSCYPGFYYDGTSSCISCTTGCQTCTGTGTTACLTCIEGFYYVAASTSCLRCSDTYPGCQSCNSTNCSICLTGFYYDSTANQCRSCATQMHGCVLCSSSSVCSFCAPGHYYNNTQTGNNSCQPCSLGCSTCQNSTNCTTCTSGYYFSAFTCLRCTNRCVTCMTSSTYCLSCIIGFYLSSPGTCTACNATRAYCLACILDNASAIQCIQCGVGFFLASGACSPCDSNCVTCNATSSCLSCQLGYYLNTSDSTCRTCSPTCAECSVNGTCQSCHVGYYLSSPNCLPCTSLGCLTCGSDLKCLSCVTGYYLTATKLCQICSLPLTNCLYCTSATNCTQCAYGFALTLSGTNMICASCSTLTGCYHCSTVSTCLTCQSGYYLTTPTCTSCPQGCRNCNNGTYCTSCGSSYFSGNVLGGLNVGQCLKCQSYLTGCDICQNNTNCITCMNGYYLSPSGTNNVCLLCQVNIPYCSICSSSVICSSCKGGYHLASTNLSCIQCSSTFSACRLCDRLGTTCTDCQTGYYINLGNCLLCSNNLPGCQICNGSATCLECSSGYFLNFPNCQLCSSIMPGCIFCNSSTVCLQCQGGYYLDSTTFKCVPCQTIGCQICMESAPTSCVTCNSLYYKSSTTACSLCRTNIVGCLTCTSSTVCTKCDVGYYLSTATNPPQCLLCSNAIQGCSICSSNSLCLQCKSMYFLNPSSQCQTCSVPMTGCTFCTNGTSCLSCGAGFFMNTSNLCQSCTDLTGCLVCKDSGTCLFCQTGYYLSGFTCQQCSIISGCYSCISNTVCTSCVGGYTLNANAGCDVAQVQADKQVTDIIFKTIYQSQTTLKHYMYLINMTYTQINTIDWLANARIFILNSQNIQVNLVISKVQWSLQNNYTLIFYTNNPLNMTQYSKKMPFARRLLSYSLDMMNTKSGIELSQTALNQILPNYQHSGSLLIDYSLNSPQFYATYSKHYQPSQFPFYIIGIVFSVILLIKYSLKALATVPRSVNIGNIIPHILCFKVGSLLLFPTYLQYISYCSGFMYVDFPWLNTFFGQLLSDYRDKAPLAYKFFYTNMNLASMYLLAFCVIIVIVIITFIVGKSCSPQYEYKMNSFFQFLYNYFGFGLIFAGCACLQGAIMNPMSSLNINGAFYILGILIYFSFLCQCIYKVSQDKINNFYKIRLLVKATLLSLSHMSPIYLMSSAVLVDLVLIVVQYKLCEYPKTYWKFWIFANVICNLALILLIFLPIIELTLVIVSVSIFLAIVFEGIIHYYQAKQKSQQPQKSKINQKEGQNVWDLNFNQKDKQFKALETNQNFNQKTRIGFMPDDEKKNTMYSTLEPSNENQGLVFGTKYKRQRNYKKAKEQNKQKILQMENSTFKADPSKQNQEGDNDKEQNLTFVINDMKY